MAQFVINQAVSTDAPAVEVTVTADKPLPIGRQRFQLVVTDDSGNTSKPDVAEVIVADQDAPTAVLTAPRVGLEIVEIGTGRKLAVPLRDNEAVQLRLLVRRGRHRATQVGRVDRPAAARGFGDPLDRAALLRGLVAL